MHYDSFRERLLHGRRELVELLDPAAGDHVVELGGGTGRNLLFFGARLACLGSIEIVDLCPALLEQARLRTRLLPNVHVVEADAVAYRPARPADYVYFSYSLSMIADWRCAIDNALGMLKPGGVLGVVDFYVSGAAPKPGEVAHSAFTRFFWPRWFAHDGVHLTPEHPRRLRELLPEHVYLERRGAVPYLPGLRVPYYVFIGWVPGSNSGANSSIDLPI